MELRHLRYFVAVAEELHFGRAAQRLHIAQPPLSQQIKKLEEELGVQLFARTRRKVALTQTGRLFLEEARQTLQQAARAQRVAQEAEQGVRGQLRVGFVTSASYSVLPETIRRFRNDNPFIDLQLNEMTPVQQIDALEQNQLDVGILRAPVACVQEMDTTIVLEEPLVAAMPAEHRLASRKKIDLKALAEEAFVLFPRQHGPGIYDVIMQLCRHAGFSPKVSYAPNEMQTILAYVAGGLGISLVPHSLSGFHPEKVVYLPLRNKRGCLQMALIKNSDSASDSVTKFFALCTAVGEEYMQRITAQR